MKMKFDKKGQLTADEIKDGIRALYWKHGAGMSMREFIKTHHADLTRAVRAVQASRSWNTKKKR